MLFTRAFDITHHPDDDWLDPVLDADIPLFVDPFLLFKEPIGSTWKAAHDELVAYFDDVFRLLANARTTDTYGEKYARARARLMFQDPDEFRLGYARSQRGSGVGKRLAEDVAEAMMEAIERGLVDIQHFEAVGIFNKGIGPDRISDLTCSVLKRFFIDYTVDVAERHGLPLNTCMVEVVGKDRRRGEVTVDLPANDYRGGAPLLLVPRRFLREVPTLNHESWWRFHRSRGRLNTHVLERVNKEEIVELARENPASVREFVQISRSGPGRPYDLDSDAKSLWRWEQLTFEFLSEHPIRTRTLNGAWLCVADLVESIVESFRHFVEHAGGWKLLWNDAPAPGQVRMARAEDGIQMALWAFARMACDDAQVAFDREADGGRGKVDFKFSRGSTEQVLLEIKKLDHRRLWHGVEQQLPAYARSFRTKDVWLVVVQLEMSDASQQRVRELAERVSGAAQRHRLNLRHVLIDGRPKPSASMARNRDD